MTIKSQCFFCKAKITKHNSGTAYYVGRELWSCCSSLVCREKLEQDRKNK